MCFLPDPSLPAHLCTSSLGQQQKKLAHLDSVMVWPDSEDGEDYDDDDDDDERDGATRRDLVDAVSALASTMTTSGGLEDAEGEPTNTLILRNLPVEFFVPSICSALLSLLNAYGTLVRWIPMPTVGRAVVVFEEVEGARLAKGGLDRLLLPFEETGQDDGAVSEGPDGPLRVDEDARAQADDSILRAVYGPAVSSDEAEASTLSVPTTDKNFLISPPGSPPVGWEPIREDPPNRDTLADDLMRALGELRDTQRHIESHQPTDWGSASQDDVRAEAQDGGGSGGLKPLRAVPAPEVILAPSMAPALRSYQPAWLRGGGGGGGGSSSSSKSNTAGLAHQLQPNSSSGDGKEGDDDDELIQVPGVTVQSFDPVEDGEGPKTHLGFTISSVKATVDSMRSPTLLAQQGHASDVPALNVGGGLGEAGVGAGGYGGSKRITPTSRPPLSD
ncbi:uncharacterized protein PSFLO_05806 [Pseudozyma flocculosa]|uniref:RRM domain-containing protein n=1 Tax=Pseudozyma flocculosa TaxID=84751 RepID=A0A5C3F773_9BASI|nr:uncharacterized protein PSFLO_05806 [Pseudozyma flocculosa]